MSEKYIHIELKVQGNKIIDDIVKASVMNEITEEILTANLKEIFIDKDSGTN